jgi:hypothetical protein
MIFFGFWAGEVSPGRIAALVTGKIFKNNEQSAGWTLEGF